jgi:hypothetical protein
MLQLFSCIPRDAGWLIRELLGALRVRELETESLQLFEDAPRPSSVYNVKARTWAASYIPNLARRLFM